MAFRLFVSHSTPAAEWPRLTAVVKALEEAGGGQLEVIYDKEQIEPGEDWRKRIAFMLHACHGAVIMLDENARNSDWVLTEAIFLSLRNQMDPKFQLIPVSLLPAEENSAESLDAKAKRAQERARFGEGTWRVVELSRLQQARGDSPAQIAVRVVDALRSQGNLVPIGSPVDRLALQLAVHFGGLSDALLDAVISALDWEGGTPYLQPDRSTQLAMAIAANLSAEGVLSEIRAALDDWLGQALRADKLLAVLDGVAPLPLDPRAASLLIRRKEPKAAGYKHVNIQTGYGTRMAQWYINRANLASRTNVMPIDNKDASFDSLQTELRATWRQHNKHLGPRSDAEVDRQLALIPRYVTLPGPLDSKVLGRLEGAYPAISFVMYSAQEFGQPLPSNVVELIPRPDSEREKEIFDDYATATDGLG